MTKNLLDFLPSNLREEVEKKIKEYKMDKKEQEEFIKRVLEEYNKKKVDVYEPIGLVTAHSLSEPATQMVIDTFHYAGVAELNVMNALPRVIEILDARTKPKVPSMEIYLKDKNLSLEEIKKLSLEIKEITLKEVVKEVHIDIVDNKIVMKLDKKALKEYQIEAEDIYKFLKGKIKKLSVELKNNQLEIKPEKKLKLRELFLLKEKLKELTIKGIKGIKNVIITENDNGEIFLLTEGSNFKEVLKLPFVDATRTITNNVFEIYEVLGIEAARNYIFEELKRIYIDQQGLEVDLRYISLVADILTVNGFITGITRYGLASMKKSVLAKIVFETPRNFLVKASLTGEEDNFKTVAENVIVNQKVPVGTGLIKVIYDLSNENKESKEVEEE
jgi:DNA-directed RNA polymerase subunit A"